MGLAAIVNADLSLDRPEFDSAERAFQLRRVPAEPDVEMFPGV